jgi:hypothetical protein
VYAYRLVAFGTAEHTAYRVQVEKQSLARYKPLPHFPFPVFSSQTRRVIDDQPTRRLHSRHEIRRGMFTLRTPPPDSKPDAPPALLAADTALAALLADPECVNHPQTTTDQTRRAENACRFARHVLQVRDHASFLSVDEEDMVNERELTRGIAEYESELAPTVAPHFSAPPPPPGPGQPSVSAVWPVAYPTAGVPMPGRPLQPPPPPPSQLATQLAATSASVAAAIEAASRGLQRPSGMPPGIGLLQPKFAAAVHAGLIRLPVPVGPPAPVPPPLRQKPAAPAAAPAGRGWESGPLQAAQMAAAGRAFPTMRLASVRAPDLMAARPGAPPAYLHPQYPPTHHPVPPQPPPPPPAMPVVLPGLAGLPPVRTRPPE